MRGAPLARNQHGCLPSNNLAKVFFSLVIAARFKAGWRDLRYKIESRRCAWPLIRWLEQRWRRGENISDHRIRDQIRPEYLLAHSLAHALITEIAIDCGYPANSRYERIYNLQGFCGDAPGVGILIYTTSAETRAPLGGLSK